ncbi:hypothetical protein Tco_1282885 [Tanacetum coccineum]
MVTEGIVLGHKVSRKGLEVDKAKINVIVVFTYHAAIKYLFSKQDAKPRLIRWILLLQEFDIEIKNKKGAENVTADHLSRLEKPNLKELKDEEINDEFPDYEQKIVYHGLETQKILDECHHGPTGGHYGPSITAKKVFDAGFYWPTIFKEAQTLLHELDELRLQAYENSKLYKARTKAYHDKKLRVRKEFKAGDKVLLYNSKYKFKAPKLRSKWRSSMLTYTKLSSNHDEEQLNELTIEEIHLMCEEGRMKAIPFMAPFPANYRETMPWASEKPYIYSVVENTCNEAKLYDLDETGKGIVIENILYVPSEGSWLEKK